MTKERVCANSRTMSRRALVTALPFSGAALAAPQIAQAHEPDPVVIAYQEWLAARSEGRTLAKLPGNENLDDPRQIAAEERELAATFRMLDSTPTTLEGIAALVALIWDDLASGSTDPDAFHRGAELIEFRAAKLIWQACTGKSGCPDVGTW